VGHEGKGFAGPEALSHSEEEVGSHAQLKHPLHQPEPASASGVQGSGVKTCGGIYFLDSGFELSETGIRVWRG
jgi:hypothetical protein